MPRGGAADRRHRDARSEERLRFLHGLEVPALIPALTPWKDEHRILGRVELVKDHVWRNPDATYGCDCITCSSDRANLVTAGAFCPSGSLMPATTKPGSQSAKVFKTKRCTVSGMMTSQWTRP